MDSQNYVDAVKAAVRAEETQDQGHVKAVREAVMNDLYGGNPATSPEARARAFQAAREWLRTRMLSGQGG